MCKLVDKKIGTEIFSVADVKEKYIENIVESAKKCDYIDKVYLFGSSITDKCTDESDIDIAVFGNVPKGKCFSSNKYRTFVDNISSYDNYSQTYDILYFQTGKKYSDSVYEDSINGEKIYSR